MLIVNEITLLWMGAKLDKFEGRAPVRHIPQFELVVRAAKKLTNFGEVKPIPDIDPELEKQFARVWLMHHRNPPTFAETDCLDSWRKLGGKPAGYRRLMDKWNALQIVVRRDPNAKRGSGTAWVAADERGTVIRIRIIAGFSPILELNALKKAENITFE